MIATGRRIGADFGDLARALGAVAARVRSTFGPLSSRAHVASCSRPGCEAPATYPCICAPELCEAHYLEEVGV